jgi:hypothetical protein
MITREQIYNYLEKMAAGPTFPTMPQVGAKISDATGQRNQFFAQASGRQQNTFGQPGGYSAQAPVARSLATNAYSPSNIPSFKPAIGDASNAVFQGAQRFQKKFITPVTNRLGAAVQDQGNAINDVLNIK